MIRYITILFICCLVALEVGAKRQDDKFTIVIDAGHGGKDIGAADNGIKEKDINLKVAKNLESLIKKKMKESRVVMTRDGDNYLTLQERADKANKEQGDIFVSIHTNSVDKKNRNRKTVAGSSVYTLGLHKDENNLAVAMRENSVIELENNYEQKYSGFDPQRDESYIIFEMAQKKNLSQSIQLADNIEKELVRSGRQDRGVHQAGFWVLWATSMPSVLIELDFICNPESAKYISSDKGAKELAEAIFKAIQKYEQSWRKISSERTYKEDTNENYLTENKESMGEIYSLSSSENITISKKRVHKTKDSQPLNMARKRRSQEGKLLSLQKDYENDGLGYNSQGKNQVEIAKIEEEGPILNEEINSVSISKEKKDKKKENKKDKKQNKKTKENNKNTHKVDSYNAKVNKLVTVYKIQILASADLLSQENSRFCGLSPITAYKENDLYKYYYGESTDRHEMESILADVRKKIPDAFIVSSQKSIKK